MRRAWSTEKKALAEEKEGGSGQVMPEEEAYEHDFLRGAQDRHDRQKRRKRHKARE